MMSDKKSHVTNNNGQLAFVERKIRGVKVDGGGKSQREVRDLTAMIGGVSSNNNRDGNDGRGTGGGDLMDTGVQRYINERKGKCLSFFCKAIF